MPRFLRRCRGLVYVYLANNAYQPSLSELLGWLLLDPLWQRTDTLYELVVKSRLGTGRLFRPFLILLFLVAPGLELLADPHGSMLSTLARDFHGEQVTHLGHVDARHLARLDAAAASGADAGGVELETLRLWRAQITGLAKDPEDRRADAAGA